MKRYLPFLIVGLVALLTLSGGFFLYRANLPPVLTISKDSDADAAEPLHVRGSANAAVTLEEFGDFECPPCGNLAAPIRQIEEENASNLRVIFYHFPFAVHPHALQAAHASEAAALQGRFWEMHDLLYREQSAWSKAKDAGPLFQSYAGILGLNLDRFKKDIESEEVKARVARDQKRGVSLKVNGTPAIFINKRTLPPTALNPDALRKAVKEAVDSKSSSG